MSVGAGFGISKKREGPSFQADVEVVHILATVRDKEGRLVQDLTRDDFVLEEEGRLQEIEFFSEQSDLPLTLGLLVDSSMSQRRILEEERQASYQFFEQILEREEDRAFVLSFDVDVELLEDLTHSRQRLKEALSNVQVPTEQGRAGIGTVLFDSVFLSAEEVLPAESQRTALVVISDGVDFGSIVTLEEAIETAQRADSIVYSIRYYDSEMYKRSGRGGGGGGIPGMGRGRGRGGGSPFPPGGNPGPGGNRRPPDGKKILEQLSVETGGRLFEVTKKQTLSQIFQQIQDELRHQYSFGYTPQGNSGTGFRTISLRTRTKGLKVQCRSGYYPADR